MNAAPPPRELLALDPKEGARVIASLFPKHLDDLRDCRKRHAEAQTWTQIDTRELEDLDSGQFVPVVERRERGRFTDSDDQTRYVIRIDNCERGSDGGPLRIEAVFSTWQLNDGYDTYQRRPRPIMQREWRASSP